MGDSMRTTHSAGGVVMNKEKQVLIVNQRGRAWSLPKGHVEQGETAQEAAEREIYEESGVKKLTLIKELGTYKRHKLTSENKDNKEELKEITIFLFTTSEEKLAPRDPENPEARWVGIEHVENMLTHPKDKAFFKKIKPEVKNV